MSNKTIIVKRHSTQPLIKFPLTQQIREKYDITHEMLQNCAVTFSMFNEETGLFKIANVQADLLIFENQYEFLDEPTYVLQYALKRKDTSEIGVFSAEFKLIFLGDNCGTITFPSDSPISLIVQPTLTKVEHSTEVEPSVPTPAPVVVPYFYGKVDVGSVEVGVNRPVASENLVKSGTKVSLDSSGTISINFNSSANDYIFFAIPVSSAAKTKWFVSSLNTGDIGGAVSVGGNLFPNADLVNITLTNPLLGLVQYRVYISNYQVETGSIIQLRNS
jgi:hypothetical protein